MRRGLLFVVLLFASLFLFSYQTLYSQEKESLLPGNAIKLPVILKGSSNPETLPDLESSYCSNGGPDDIYLDSSVVPVPAGNTHIIWNVVTNVGGIPAVHSDWIEPIGTDPNNGIRFFPDRVPESFQGMAIFFQYQLDDGSSGYDYTYIRKSPTSYTLSGGTDICNGSNATLSLDGSDSGFEYVLLKDGVTTSSVFPVSGNGSPINFSVSAPGIYTVQARRSDEPSCPEMMDGSATIQVNALPEPTTSSNSAVCEGNTIELYGDTDGAATYSWSGPDGFSSTELNPVLSDASSVMAGTYTLSVIDANNCQNTSSTEVVVHENPLVSVSNSGPVCENQSVTLSAKVTGGTAPFNYRWEKDGVLQPLLTTADIVFSNVQLTDVGLYEVFVTDGNNCSNVVSASTTLEVNENPSIVEVLNDGPVCEGGTLSLSVSVTGGTAPYTFAWTGPNGFSSSEQNPIINNITDAEAGNYVVKVTDALGCGSATSGTTVVVKPVPVATAVNDGPSCIGTDIQLLGGPGGMASYAWSGPDGFVSSQQNPTLSDVTADVGGIFSLTVTDPNGCSNTATTPVVVNELPVVSLSSTGPVCEGGTLSLSSTVSGGVSPYSYVWKKDGSVLSGLTTQNLTINNVSLADAGVYELLVTDDLGCGSAVSASTTVVVNENPVISSIDNDGPVCEGQALGLSVAVTGGNAPYNFSWTGPDGFASNEQNPLISGVTSAALGDYQVVVSDDSGCSSASALTTVVVNETPSVVVSNSGPVCEGEAVTISATTSGGTPSYSYEWTKNGSVLTGVNTSSLQLLSVSSGDAGDYVVTVSDDKGCSVVSASTPLEVYDLPELSLSGDVSVCEGNIATFSVGVTGGNGDYEYRWSHDGKIILGESRSTLVIVDAKVAQTGTYSVVVTDGLGCSSVSASANLTVKENPVVSISGAPVIEACSGSDVVLDASATGGNGSYDFIWELPDGSTATGEDLSLNSITADKAGIYQLFVSDGLSCGDTAQVEVVVNDATASISISSPSGGSAICAGEAVTFNAAGGVNFDFYVNGEIKASNSSGTYTTSSLSDGDQVFVHVSDGKGCEDDSEVITMTVHPNPIVSLTVTSPNGNTPCLGQTVEFTATSGFVNYVYSVNGSEVQNDVSNIYTTDALTSGDQVTVLAYSSEGCSGTSTPQTITFNPLPEATLVSDRPDDAACPGEVVNFTAGGGSTYEFLVDGVSQGAPSVTNTFSVNAPVAGSSSTVSVAVTDVNGCSDTTSVVLSAYELPVVTIGPDQIVCQGETIAIDAIVSGGAESYSYSWTKDGNPLAGITTSSISFPSVALDDAGLYQVTVSDAHACGDVTDDVNIQVNSRPSVTLDSNSPVCEGQELSLEASAYGGSGSGKYIWYKEGSEIVGVTTPNFSVTSAQLSDAGTYEVVALDDNGCQSSAVAVSVSVNPKPVATLSADQLNIFSGTLVTFTAGGGEEYTFFKNGTEVQPRGADNTYTDDSLVDGDEISVSVFNAANCSETASVVIHVFDDVAEPLVTLENGSYCQGDAGANVIVQNQMADVSYELVYADNSDAGYPIIDSDGSSPVRWEGVTDLTNPTTFKVAAYLKALPDEKTYSSEFQVTENALPDVYAISVNGTVVTDELVYSDCNGGDGYDISLSPTWGTATYQLMLNGTQVLETIDGGPSPVIFKDYDQIGTYTVVATNGFGCMATMKGKLIIEGNGFDVGFDLTMNPADGLFCEGSTGATISLEGSLEGADYVLFKDGFPVDTMAGTGNSILYESITEGGQYHVEVLTSGGCSYPMNNSLTLTSQPAPNIGTLSVTNGGHYCEGPSDVMVSLDNQENDVRYDLVNADDGSVIVSHNGVSGDGSFFFKMSDGADFFAEEGAFYVKAVDVVTGCESVSNQVDVVMDPLPLVYDFTGDTEICAEGGTAVFTVEGSQSGVSYELYIEDAATGEILPGDGSMLSFSASAQGNYGIVATNTETGCKVVYPDVVTVSEKPMPLTNLSVTSRTDGTVGDCDEGVYITVESTQNEVTYELVKILGDGTVLYTGETITGDGSNQEFSALIQDKAAKYGVMATLDGCAKLLDATDSVDVSATIPQRFEMTYPSGMCTGDIIQPGLSNSEIGVDYQLYRDGVAGEKVAGTGSAFTFAAVLEEGLYWVEATSNSGCTNSMIGEMDLKFNPVPGEFSMTGSGFHCGDGAVLGVDGSEAGIEYTLLREEAGSDVLAESVIADPAGSFAFSAVMDEGKYFVRAVNPASGCSALSNDTVEVIIKTAPAKPQLLQADTVYYCSGDAYHMEVVNAEVGVTYQVFDRVNNMVAEKSGGLSGSLEMGPFLEGAYVVRSSWGGDACISENSDSIWVFQSPDPNVLTPFDVDETIYLFEDTVGYSFEADALEPGVTYRLINETTPSDTIQFEFEGAEKMVSFSVAGIYKLEGLFADSGCEPVTMNDRLVVLDFEWMSDKEVPNAFSPNGDGINDYFEIPPGRMSVEKSRLEVFNRWGTIVYRSKGKVYDDSWDGTSNVHSMISIGDKLPNGVYFYIFSVEALVEGEDGVKKNVSKKFHGFIELRR